MHVGQELHGTEREFRAGTFLGEVVGSETLAKINIGMVRGAWRGLGTFGEF